jgi:ribonuclease HI
LAAYFSLRVVYTDSQRRLESQGWCSPSALSFDSLNQTSRNRQPAIMVYVMEIFVDGGCRRNGSVDAIAAAAAVRRFRWGAKYLHRERRLSDYRQVTNQRAEITAIILGLEMAMAHQKDLDTDPWLDMTIKSDSAYAVNCMTDFISRWSENGWINARGQPVANKDLIMEASRLDDEVMGHVKYVWIPRSKNTLDKHCNEEMDAMEAGGY